MGTHQRAVTGRLAKMIAVAVGGVAIGLSVPSVAAATSQLAGEPSPTGKSAATAQVPHELQGRWEYNSSHESTASCRGWGNYGVRQRWWSADFRCWYAGSDVQLWVPV